MRSGEKQELVRKGFQKRWVINIVHIVYGPEKKGHEKILLIWMIRKF